MNILKDKVIVVVGTSSGIGAAISEYFCNHGAITCIFGRRKERLEKLCDRAKEKNQRMYPYTGDARNYSNLARMAEQIVGCFGKIDVWINCAGKNKAIGCLWDLDSENLWMETEVNLKSAMNGTHIALKYMCLENNGTILNFCGGGAGKTHVFAAVYSTSKAAIARFTESVALEIQKAGFNIGIFSTNPGLVRNERTLALCESTEGKTYMPEIQQAFYQGKEQSPLTIAHLVEAILEGELRGLKGRLIECFDRENLTEMKKNENTEWGLLRIINYCIGGYKEGTIYV